MLILQISLMKYFKILIILLLSSTISFYACDDSDNAKARKIGPTEVPNLSNLTVRPNAVAPNAATSNPTTPEPPQNTAGVWHYTCSNGCTGGAGAAGNCATCGGPLAHNQAYHANGTPTLPSGVPPVTPSATSSGQNAAGVWHYICGNGCAGGAGAAGTCATCGGTLAHNAAYHQ